VFAETEIVSLLSEKQTIEDIAYGMHKAIAKRVISMGTAGQINYREPVVFSGGVAKNIGVVRAIEEELAMNIITLEEPQITAALGAAIIARENNT
jgi:activator of 2-hydroxyglutaryl-CoA dehydratase